MDRRGRSKRNHIIQPPKLALQKTIFQVRYKPDLNFYNLFINAARQFREYPHWQTDKLSVVLREFEKHCSVSIRHDSFSYEQDSSDESLEIRSIQKVIEVLPTALEILSFIRVGYRRQYLVSTGISFESLVKVLNIKLFSMTEDFQDIIPKNIEDLTYRTDASDELGKYHFTVGPVRKQEIPKYVIYNRENHLHPNSADKEYQKLFDRYPDVSVFIDIDIYRIADQISCEEVISFAEIGRERVKNLANDLTNYFFYKDVDTR